ncbi:MAG: hypothetical protein WDM79_13280 [Terricaulis sp.]
MLNSVKADSARVANVADRYQEYAYVLQRQSWANAVAQGQPARLQRMRDVAPAGRLCAGRLNQRSRGNWP